MVDPNLLGLGKKVTKANPGQWPTFQRNNKRTGYQGDKMVGGGELPQNFGLFQNYPNPWPNPTNPLTTLRYAIPVASDVSIVIYNIQGQEIMRWEDSNILPGLYEKTWDGTNKHGEPVTSGIYFYRLRVGDFAQTKKMVLLK